MCMHNQDMPAERKEVMTVKLSTEEIELRDVLAEHLGIDGSGVMRMALLELGRARGFDLNGKSGQARKPDR